MLFASLFFLCSNKNALYIIFMAGKPLSSRIESAPQKEIKKPAIDLRSHPRRTQNVRKEGEGVILIEVFV